MTQLDTATQIAEVNVERDLRQLLKNLRGLQASGNNSGARIRYLAVAITEAEKLLAFYRTYVLEEFRWETT